MQNKIEIHCVKIDKTNSSASVIGKIRSDNNSVRGSTNTFHTSQVTADGKMYTLKQKNTSYPFSDGDKMMFICCKDNKTGMYIISSLINITNGTKLIQSPISSLVGCWILAFLSFLAPIVGLFAGQIGLIWGLCMIPLAIGYALLYTIKIYPNEKRAVNKLISLDGVNSKEDMQGALLDYKGKSIVSCY